MKHRLLELRRHGGEGEWNEKRNLAPGFIREEENKGMLLLPTMLRGGRGGAFSGQIHTRESDKRLESGPKER